MAELIPLEKLQPCLLDRLTDDEPRNSEESRNQRVISLQRYRRGVLRDIEWLLNASAYVPPEQEEDLSNYPEVQKSVLNFGTRHLYGMLGIDIEEFERDLAEAIQRFEPRIMRNSLAVKAVRDQHTIALEIQATLWANPIPDRLFIKTKIDLETGQALLGDAAHG